MDDMNLQPLSQQGSACYSDIICLCLSDYWSKNTQRASLCYIWLVDAIWNRNSRKKKENMLNFVIRTRSSLLVYQQAKRRPGPRFTNVFSIAIQIRWKFRFALISILMQWLLHNFVLCCRDMCKHLLRSVGQLRNNSTAKFPSNLNYGQKNR